MHLDAFSELCCIVIGFDRDAQVRYLNAYAARRLGYEAAPPSSGLAASAVVTAVTDDIDSLVCDVAASGKARRGDGTLLIRNAHPVALMWNLQHFEVPEVPDATVWLIGIDEPDGSGAESGVPRSIFRTLVENCPQSVMITDANRRIIYCNEATCQITGFGIDEILGQTPAFFRSGLTPVETYEGLYKTLGCGETWRGEFINRKKNGETFVEERLIGALRNADGEVRFYFAVGEDRSARERFQLTLEQLASLDQLTGLPNRGAFMRALGITIDEARRNGLDVALLYADIDDFFRVNEYLSSDEADRLLIEAGARIRSSLRGGDPVGRLGGDEFAVMLGPVAERSAAEVDEIATRIVRDFRAPFQIGDQLVNLSLSVGVARFPVDGVRADELLTHAITAAAGVKQDGGDSFRGFDATMIEGMTFRRRTLADLGAAIDAGQFVLYYQPQVSLTSGAVTGLEALIRWKHPVRGMISPGEFIPLAEESGLIVEIGRWVLNEACRQIRCWSDQGIGQIKVAVNMSPRHFRLSDLDEQVADALARHGVTADCLEVEITEGAMMVDVASAIRATHKLKDLGIRLSLDDFGTGYSSLAYLSRFPIDVVKIDQSFIREITVDPASAAIAQATIAVSHKLGKKVLAEGVETREQMAYLRRNECDEMQGYYFARPMPADDVATLLGSGRKLDLGNGADAARPMILLVDDEHHILSALKRTLRREGYEVLTAESGPAALALLAEHAVQVIISDQRMPGMSGTEFLSRVKELHPRTVRIVLSGYAEATAVADAINKGAVYRFIMKPWEDDQLKLEIENAMRHWRQLFGS